MINLTQFEVDVRAGAQFSQETLLALVARVRELTEALQGMSELCGNYFDESQLVCDRDREIWKAMLAALITTA